MPEKDRSTRRWGKRRWHRASRTQLEEQWCYGCFFMAVETKVPRGPRPRAVDENRAQEALPKALHECQELLESMLLLFMFLWTQSGPAGAGRSQGGRPLNWILSLWLHLVSNSQSPMTGTTLSLACDRMPGRVHRSLASDRQCDCQALQAADNALWSTGLSRQRVPGATPSPCLKS